MSLPYCKSAYPQLSDPIRARLETISIALGVGAVHCEGPVLDIAGVGVGRYGEGGRFMSIMTRGRAFTDWIVCTRFNSQAVPASGRQDRQLRSGCG